MTASNRWLLGLTTLAGVFLALAACSGGTSRSSAESPESAVTAYVKNFNAQDCAALEAAITSRWRDSEGHCTEFNYDPGQVVNIDSITSVAKYPNADHPRGVTLRVRVSGNLGMDGEPSSGTCEFDVVKVASKWLIDGENCIDGVNIDLAYQ